MKLCFKRLAVGNLLLLTILCAFQSSCSSPDPGTTNPEKFLMVLDVQKYSTSDTTSCTGNNMFLKTINAAIEKFNSENVIYIKSVARTLSVTLKGFKVDTVPGSELDERLKVVNDQIINKKKANAFKTKEVTDFFLNHHAHEIVVIGIAAEKCVLKTVLGGKKLEYEMFVIPEAIAGESGKAKEKALNTMVKNGIKFFP